MPGTSATHTCDTVVVQCIDWRLRSHIEAFLQRRDVGTYDLISIPGGVKNRESVLNALRISMKLHAPHRVILINHEDCGAYGDNNAPETHAADLQAMREFIETEFSNVQIETYFMHLNGDVIEPDE